MDRRDFSVTTKTYALVKSNPHASSNGDDELKSFKVITSGNGDGERGDALCIFTELNFAKEFEQTHGNNKYVPFEFETRIKLLECLQNIISDGVTHVSMNPLRIPFFAYPIGDVISSFER